VKNLPIVLTACSLHTRVTYSAHLKINVDLPVPDLFRYTAIFLCRFRSIFIKMDNLKKILEVLNDLIRINKDREAGYAKASRELTPAEHNLRSAFERKAQESRNNIVQLENLADEIHQQLNDEDLSNEPDSSAGMSGRIYRMWAEVKDFFTAKDKPSVLRSFVNGEAKAKSCYENALEEVQMPEYICTLLNNHKTALDVSHQEIAKLLKS